MLDRKYRMVAFLLALIMLLSPFGVLNNMEVKAQEGDEGSVTEGFGNWEWPDNMKISSDGKLINTGIQFVRMEDNNQTIVVRMDYKASMNPKKLDWIYFRFDPVLAAKIDKITSKVGWGQTRTLVPLTDAGANDHPYGEEEEKLMWRVPLAKPGEGIFTSAPLITANYDKEFKIHLKAPLNDEDMQKSYSMELRIMGKENDSYTVSRRTINNQIIINPASDKTNTKGNWLKGATVLSTYESFGTIDKSYYNQKPQSVPLEDGKGLVRFRYKYFPDKSYNIAAWAKKPYQMKVKISENIMNALDEDNIFINARLAGTKFNRGTSVVASNYESKDGYRTFIISKKANTATDTRDYLQPETGELFPGITDIVIPVDESKLSENNLYSNPIIAEISFIDAKGVEITNSRARSYIRIEKTEPPVVYNLEAKDTPPLTNNTLTDDEHKNIARITQNTLKGKTEQAGVVEKPDPNDDKNSIMELEPSRVIVKDENGNKLGKGIYKADENGNFDITFDNTFEEMGFKVNDEIQIQVYAMAAGKTVSDPISVRLIDEKTNTPTGIEDDYVLYDSYKQIKGQVERHLYGTEFTGELTLKNIDGIESSTIPVSSENVTVTPEGTLTITLPKKITSELTKEDVKLNENSKIEVALTEDTYSKSDI